ncbi:MAG: hypothetical protein H6563_08115 [Lewinellaceae bacterium]|nr:hypothetical protein [Lewinellaceae bacterium]
MSEIVDTASAKEFMQEVLGKVSADELTAIAGSLELKSRFFKQTLDREALDQLSGDQAFQLLRSVFATRRSAKKILEAHPVGELKKWMMNLLYGEEAVEARFQTFCQQLGQLDLKHRTDLAGELLHFTFPDQYWLWCRWMWDPKTKTGALPLVVTENFDLGAPTEGEAYLKVGKAVAFVHHTGEAAGFQNISRTLFGTDVFLCSVYVIYTYTVLRMRMTQEFNKVVPDLAEFTRRLLGVHRLNEFEN